MPVLGIVHTISADVSHCFELDRSDFKTIYRLALNNQAIAAADRHPTKTMMSLGNDTA